MRFHEDEAVEVMRRYLVESCHSWNPKMFDSEGVSPTESQVMEVIGWSPVVRGATGGARTEGETGWADADV